MTDETYTDGYTYACIHSLGIFYDNIAVHTHHTHIMYITHLIYNLQ